VELGDVYAPIACELHSHYERAAGRRSRLLVGAKLENGSLIRDPECRALDVLSRPEGEFLLVSVPRGAHLALRLDRLLRVVSTDDGARLDR
jgi:transcriptional antiterminator Rof (Rho-off)